MTPVVVTTVSTSTDRRRRGPGTGVCGLVVLFVG